MVQQNYEETHETFEAILRAIIQELDARPGKDNVSLALYFLLVREANTWRSIRLLRRHTPEQFHTAFMVDAGTLLRAMFDAYLQADLIFRDPAKRAVLATDYLDFEHVERHKMAQKVLRHDNALTNVLKSSAKRPEGEKRLQQEFDRVKGTFLVEQKQSDGTVKRGPRTRDKWYKGDLPQLAKDGGKEVEYDAFVASFSGCVHSSAFAVRNGPMFPEKHVLSLVSTFGARVAKMNVDYNQLEIGDNRLILEELCKSWVDRVEEALGRPGGIC